MGVHTAPPEGGSSVRAPRGMWIWLLGAIGLGVGYALFAVGAGHHQACRFTPDAKSCHFFSNISQFHTWLALVGAQVALWFALAPGLLLATTELWQATSGLWQKAKVRDYVPAAVAYLAFSGFVLVTGGMIIKLLKPVPPLIHYPGRVTVLTVLGLLVVAPAATGMWRILAILAPIHKAYEQAKPGGPERLDGTAVATVIAMRRILKIVVGYVGAVIGSIALSTGALRIAVVAWNTMASTAAGGAAGGFDFPQEFVLLYAIFFVVLLALVYIPVYLSLERAGRQILEAAFPIPAGPLGTGSPKADWYTGRKALEDLLQLGIRLEESLRAGVAILAPLGGLLLSTFLPGAKP